MVLFFELSKVRLISINSYRLTENDIKKAGIVRPSLNLSIG